MTLNALILALSTVFPVPPQSDPVGPDLRALAEIDGDRATFTAEEARKLALLRQVLGTPPIATPAS